MDLPHRVIAALDDETMQDLERLAAHFGCSVEHLATTALMRFVNEESRLFPTEFDDLPAYESPDPLVQALYEANRKAAEAFAAFIKPAEEAAERGELIPHEELMAQLRALDEEARAKRNAA